MFPPLPVLFCLVLSEKSLRHNLIAGFSFFKRIKTLGVKKSISAVVISISLAELLNRIFIDYESNLLRKIRNISKRLYHQILIIGQQWLVIHKMYAKNVFE